MLYYRVFPGAASVCFHRVSRRGACVCLPVLLPFANPAAKSLGAAVGLQARPTSRGPAGASRRQLSAPGCVCALQYALWVCVTGEASAWRDRKVAGGCRRPAGPPHVSRVLRGRPDGSSRQAVVSGGSRICHLSFVVSPLSCWEGFPSLPCDGFSPSLLFCGPATGSGRLRSSCTWCGLAWRLLSDIGSVNTLISYLSTSDV